MVTRDVPPYAIVQGVPARIVGYRFDEDTIRQLLNLKWWEKEDTWMRENCQYFNDVNRMLAQSTASERD